MCGITCCFGCLSVFGCRNVVARKLVFFPPPPRYALEVKEGADGRQRQICWIVDDNGGRILPYSSRNFRIDFLPARLGKGGKAGASAASAPAGAAAAAGSGSPSSSPGSDSGASAAAASEVGLITVPSKKSKGGREIAVMFITYPNSAFTVLFSHGNAADIGCMRDHLIDMAMKLKCSVVCYDYEGYGLSGGKSSVNATLDNADSVYDHMTRPAAEGGMGLRPEQIILYGQSLGSGPTAHLAAKHRVAGVVLHAGLMSGLRVIKETDKTRFFDIFANVDLIAHCEAPVFVIHGRADEEIPIHHGQGLYEAAPNKFEPWFPEGAGHNNVEVVLRGEYFARLKAFLDFCAR